MNRALSGLVLVVALPLLLAPQAFGQASAMSNCRYYMKTVQDFEQGLPYCKQAIEENPEDPEARFYGGWCLAESGELAAAWESFGWLIEHQDQGDKKIDKHAEWAEERVRQYYANFFNRGVELLNAEDTQGAMEAFGYATLIDPRKTDAYLNLGFTQTQLDDLDGALASFSAAIAIDPENSTAREYHWDALRRKRRALLLEEVPDEAKLAEVTAELRTTLDGVLSVDPANAEAHMDMAGIDYEAGNTDSAMEHLKKAVEIAPENVVELYNRGIEFYQADKYDAAIAAFTAVLDFVPEDPSDDIYEKTSYVLALSYLYSEDYASSLVVFEKLTEQFPDNLDYWAKAGTAASRRGPHRSHRCAGARSRAGRGDGLDPGPLRRAEPGTARPAAGAIEDGRAAAGRDRPLRRARDRGQRHHGRGPRRLRRHLAGGYEGEAEAADGRDDRACAADDRRAGRRAACLDGRAARRSTRRWPGRRLRPDPRARRRRQDGQPDRPLSDRARCKMPRCHRRAGRASHRSP